MVTSRSDVDPAARRRAYAALARLSVDQFAAAVDWLEWFVSAGERMADPPPGSCLRCGSAEFVSRVWVPLPMPTWKRLLLRRQPTLVERMRCEPCGREFRPPIGPARPEASLP